MIKQQTQYRIKGISQDLATQLFNPDYAFEMKNIRLTTTDSLSLFSLTNELGNKKIINNTELLGTVIGVGSFQDCAVIFTTADEEQDENHIDRIYLFSKEETIKCIYEGDLNFDKDHLIQALCVYENDNSQKVYWIDGKNTPRVLNIAYDKNNIKPDKAAQNQGISFLPKLTDGNEQVIISKGHEGIMPAGMIQYAITYSTYSLQESNIWYVSPLYSISSTNKGMEADKSCNASFTLDFSVTEEGENVTTLNQKYDYIQIYVIIRTSLNSTPAVYKISNIPTSSLQFIDNGTRWESIAPGDILNRQITGFIPMTMGVKGLTLFFGNYKLTDTYINPNDNIVKTNLERLRNNLSLDFKDIASDSEDSYKTFRNNEFYRIGIQFMDEYGTPSNVLYLKDIKADIESYSPNSESKADFKQKIIKLISPKGLSDMSKESFIKFLNGKYKMRLMMVDRTILPHNTVCQGLICPTIFNLKDRMDNAPFAISSWCMRPLHYNSVHKEDISGSETVYDGITSYPCAPLRPTSSANTGELMGQADKSIKDLFVSKEYTVSSTDTNYVALGILFRIVTPNIGQGAQQVFMEAYVYKTNTANDDYHSISDITTYIRQNWTGSSLAYPGIGGDGIAYWMKNDKDLKKNYISNMDSTYKGLREQIKTALRNLTGLSNVDTLYDNLTSDIYFPSQKELHDNALVSANFSMTGSFEFVEQETAIDGKVNEPFKVKGTSFIFNKTSFESRKSEADKIGNLFVCDHSILTLNSPDIEKYQTIIDKNNNLSLNIVGYTRITSNSFTTHFNISEPPDANGGVLNFSDSDPRGYYNAPLWRDGTYDFATYIWHQSTRMGGSEHGKYSRKIMSNVRRCESTYHLFSVDNEEEKKHIGSFINSFPTVTKFTPSSQASDVRTITDLTKDYFHDVGLVCYPGSSENNIGVARSGVPRVFNSLEVQNLVLEIPNGWGVDFEEINYQGNVNLSISNSNTVYTYKGGEHNQYPTYGKELYSEDSDTTNTIIKYKSAPHAVIPMEWIKDSLGDINVSSLPLRHQFGIYGVLDYPSEYSDNGIKRRGLLWVNSNTGNGIVVPGTGKWYPKRKHPLTNKLNPDSTGVIYIGELSYNYKNAQSIYGDTNEETLSTHTWIPISEWAIINKNNIANNREAFEDIVGYGDTFLGRWDCLKTLSFSNDDGQSYIDITSVIIESDKDVTKRTDNLYGTTKGILVTEENFDKYNEVYDQQDNFFSYHYLTEQEFSISDFPNTICWSSPKIPGNSIDSWTSVNPAQSTPIGIGKQSITSLNNIGDSLFCFTEDNLYKINYDEKRLLTDSTGADIFVGNSGQMDTPTLMDSYNGVKSWRHTAVLRDTLYYSSKGSIFSMSGQGIKNLTALKGMESYSKNNSISSVVTDNSIGDVYFNTGSEVLAFNNYIDEFVSLYDYQDGKFFFDIDNNTYSIGERDGQTLGIYKQHTPDINSEGTEEYYNFYDVNKGFYVSLLSSENPLVSKIFTNVEYTMTATDLNSALDVHSSFDRIKVENSYQKGESKLEHVFVNPSNLKRKFRIWRINIPREYNTMTRISDTWAKVTLIKDVNQNIKYRINNINTQYFI